MYKLLNRKKLCPGWKTGSFGESQKQLRIVTPGWLDNCHNHINIVNSVVDAINVPVKIEFSKALGKYENGKWNGAIGSVVNNRSDVAIGTFTATYERSQWTQISSILGYASPVSILSGRHSQHSKQNQFQVFETFSSDVWLGLLVSVLMVGVIQATGIGGGG